MNITDQIFRSGKAYTTTKRTTGSQYLKAFNAFRAGLRKIATPMAVLLVLFCPISGFADIDLANLGNAYVKVYGEAANDNLAYFVSSAGDVNSDGYSDLLVGAPNANPSSRTDAGTAYLIFGSAGQSASAIDTASLTAATGIKILGAVGNDQLGYSVSAAGDLNKDGYDDIIIGAPYASPSSRYQAGAVLVIFGKATASWANIDASTVPAAGVGYWIYGATAGDGAGWSVGAAGDVNNDGNPDIVVGANLATVSGISGGCAYVIFGKGNATTATDLDLATFTSSSTNGFRVYGTTHNLQCAYTVSGAGDVNGDGYDDVLVGCVNLAYSGRSNSGSALVLFGHSSATPYIDLTISTMTSAYGYVIYGPMAGANLGVAVSKAGDVNNDGIDDLIIGAWRATLLGRSNCGATYVIFGRSSGNADIDTASFTSGSAGFIVIGAEANDNLGRAVAGGEDVNGDGIDDVICGAYGTDIPAGWEGGKSFVILGHPTSYTFTDIDTASLATAQGNTITGAAAYDQSGYSVAMVPDFDGDGAGDVLVGAFAADAMGRNDAGAAYLLYGTPYYYQTRSYQVRNGFAFAAIAADGSLHAWGEEPNGGNITSVYAQTRSGVEQVVHSRFAFAALKTDGSLHAWGVPSAIKNAETATTDRQYTTVLANEAAFAATNGTSLAVFGSRHNGGYLNPAESCGQAVSGPCYGGTAYTGFAATAGAFAVLMQSGLVYAWGNRYAASVIPTDLYSALQNVMHVVATREAFAALRTDGRVVAWGSHISGGDTSAVQAQLQSGVIHLAAGASVFVAFKPATRSVVVWGYGPHGGDTSSVAAQLTSGVITVAFTRIAIAALKEDGTVVAWGAATGGGQLSVPLTNIASITGNFKAFAAVNATGGVVAWGNADQGGQIPADKAAALSSGVVSISHTDRAFAALKSDGSVVVWGQPYHGGNPGAAVQAQLASGVHTICANDVAFTVIKTDGTAWGWGHSVSIPVEGQLFSATALMNPVQC